MGVCGLEGMWIQVVCGLEGTWVYGYEGMRVREYMGTSTRVCEYECFWSRHVQCN